MPPPHNFRHHFTLVKNQNNPSNALAICNWCISKNGGLATTQLKPECCTVNRARLCRNHLSKCDNFREQNTEEEVQRVLALSIPEDSKKRRKKNKEMDDEESDTNESTTLHSNSIISSTSSHSSINNRQFAITNFFCRPFSANDRLRFEQLLLRMIVSNALSFTFVENEDTIAVFEFVMPGFKLPKRKVIGGKVLMKSAQLLQNNIIKISKEDIDGVTATFDGWTNVKQEHIWGVVFITTGGQSLIWGAHDVSSERSQTQNVINHIEQLIAETEEKKINIKAFVSDSAGEYVAARRQLRRKYPSKIFLPCMAHQTNLVFGEIFKESSQYRRISKEAIRIVSFFRKSTFFTGNLRDEQMRIYKKPISLIMPGDTRWNSYYFCFHSILKTKSALKFLSAKFNDHRENVIRTSGIPSLPANNQTTLRNGTRKLPDDVADIINDGQFWILLTNLQDLLYPLCGFLNKLQKDTARLYEVLHCFGYIMKIFECHQDIEFGTRMKKRIESRWNEWEQPLILLSFVLHPQYKLTKFNSIIANLSWTHIGQWLKYYYEAWFNSKPISILAELIQYKRGIDPYDTESFMQFNGNLVDFWESTEGVGPELARAAIRIHGICVNSASVERLWSSMGLLHTNRRNRLQPEKVLAMSIIRSDILCSRKIKNAKEYENQLRRLHIATPISSGDETSEQELTITDLDYQVSDNEDEDNIEEPTDESGNLANQNLDDDLVTEEEQRWEYIINEWIELADRENQFENQDDEILLTSDWDSDFSFGGRDKHPADDETAKWPLDSLFISSLEKPSYFDSELISNR